MKKLTLEHLQVESFRTSIAPTGIEGTVVAHSGEVPKDTEAQCNGSTNTEGPTCGPENTCGYYYDTCVESWNGSCYACGHTAFCTEDNGGCG